MQTPEFTENEEEKKETLLKKRSPKKGIDSEREEFSEDEEDEEYEEEEEEDEEDKLDVESPVVQESEEKPYVESSIQEGESEEKPYVESSAQEGESDKLSQSNSMVSEGPTTKLLSYPVKLIKDTIEQISDVIQKALDDNHGVDFMKESTVDKILDDCEMSLKDNVRVLKHVGGDCEF